MEEKLKMLFRNVALRNSFFKCRIEGLALDEAVRIGVQSFRNRALGNSEYGVKVIGAFQSLVRHCGMIEDPAYLFVDGDFVLNPPAWKPIEKDGKVTYERDNTRVDSIIKQLLETKSFVCRDGRVLYIDQQGTHYNFSCFGR